LLDCDELIELLELELTELLDELSAQDNTFTSPDLKTSEAVLIRR